MKTKRGLDRKSFERKFGTNEDCLNFLAQQKWNEGFNCSRCNYNLFSKGKKGLNRRCKECGYEESPTSNTLFHKLKFDLHKAFGMIYDILLSKKGANSIWLAERYEVSQNTAWLFRRKVQQYLESSESHPLNGEVHVDEFEIGTPKEGKQGRASTDEKIRLVIAVEIRPNGVGNAYAKVINDFSTASLKQIFDKHISIDASVKTDGWVGYGPLKRIYKKLTQEKSDMGKNFPDIHIQIRNLKNWLRGIHSHCSFSAMQDYLNEYFYRFNRKTHRQSMINKALDRFLGEKSLTLRQIVQ